jgi:hypothetical protein
MSNVSLTDLASLTPNHVIPSIVEHDGHKALRLVLTPDAKTPDEPNFAMPKGIEFGNGTIEIWLAGRRAPDAPPDVRGFVGIAFRIADNCEKFECVYLRPDNGRAEDQLRRNRSIQYFSYPDYKFDRLRREVPGQYESYVDLVPGAWTKLRIEVDGAKARVFVHDAEQPTLIVNDLKHGAALGGAIGLYIDRGTEAFFRDLKVSSK